mmetsp:Transcript_3997/g.8155  ORF Transcript_3997/g.8155 Transcript_3997/m.8155 type:complete len:323 (+) Transcript_3997:2-970(+)
MAVVGFLSSATGIQRQRPKSLLEYWLFRFPFYLHCGWLLVCTVVQFSMVFRYRFTQSTGAQLGADIVALGVLLPPGTFFLTGQSSGPDFVIPLVIVWAYLSIAVELNNPSDTLVQLYGHPAILAVKNASYVFMGLIGVMLIPRIIIWIAQEFFTIDVVELVNDHDDEDYITTTMNEVRNGGGNRGDGYGGASGGGLFHRFSLRINGGGDDDDDDGDDEDGVNQNPSSLNTNTNVHGDSGCGGGGNGGNDAVEGLAGVSRRLIGNDDYVLEDEDVDEEQYQDCHETDTDNDNHNHNHNGDVNDDTNKNGEIVTERTKEDAFEE